MKDFGVCDEVQASDADACCYQDALPTMWVKRRTGAQTRCRLACKGCSQETTDHDVTYASTPLLISLQPLLLAGLTRNYSFNFHDDSIAFLHAELKKRCTATPCEFHLDGGMAWRQLGDHGRAHGGRSLSSAQREQPKTKWARSVAGPKGRASAQPARLSEGGAEPSAGSVGELASVKREGPAPARPMRTLEVLTQSPGGGQGPVEHDAVQPQAGPSSDPPDRCVPPGRREATAQRSRPYRGTTLRSIAAEMSVWARTAGARGKD